MKNYKEIRFEGNLVPTKSLRRVRHIFSRTNRTGQITCITPSGEIHVWNVASAPFAGNKCKSKRKKGGDARKKRTLITVKTVWVGIRQQN